MSSRFDTCLQLHVNLDIEKKHKRNAYVTDNAYAVTRSYFTTRRGSDPLP